MACGKPPEKATRPRQSGGPTAASVSTERIYRHAKDDVASATQATSVAASPNDLARAERAVTRAQAALEKAKAAGVDANKVAELSAKLDAARRRASAMAMTVRADQAALEEAQYRALAKAIVGAARPPGGAREVAPRPEDVAAAAADMKALADARKKAVAEARRDGRSGEEERNAQLVAKVAHERRGHVRSSSRGKVQIDLFGLLEDSGSLTYDDERDKRWTETDSAGTPRAKDDRLHSHIPTEYRATPMWRIDIGKPMGVLTVPRDPQTRSLLWPMWKDKQHNEVPPGFGEGRRA